MTTTLWVNCPLWVSQLSQLSLPSFLIGKWIVKHLHLHGLQGWRPLKRQTRATCCCVAAGQSPWVQPELRLRLKLVNDGPVCDAQYHWSVTSLGALYKWTLSFTFLFNSWLSLLCWRSVHSSILATRSKPEEFSSLYVSRAYLSGAAKIALKFQAIAEQNETNS